jgi:hypothetical protein
MDLISSAYPDVLTELGYAFILPLDLEGVKVEGTDPTKANLRDKVRCAAQKVTYQQQNRDMPWQMSH